MAGIDNLKPFKSVSEAREKGRKGGIASGEARKEKKLIAARILRRMGVADLDAIVDGMIARAKKYGADAVILRDTIGEKPSDKMEMVGTPQIVVAGKKELDAIDGLKNA